MIIQFACLIAIALTGPVIARHPVMLVTEITGIVLGVWAIVAQRFVNFNVTPDVKIEGFLVERGPYAVIRHPMYATLILIALALVTDSFTWSRLLMLVVLVVDLLVKLRYEEGLLSAHYPQYAAYMARTNRLLPYVY